MTKHVFLTITIILFSNSFFSQPQKLNQFTTIADKIRTLDQYIEVCFTNEKYGDAKRASLLALQFSQKAKIDTLVTKNLYNVGFAYKNLSNFDSAIYYFNLLQKFALKGNPRLLVKTQLNLASSYENIGRMDSVSALMKRLELSYYLNTNQLSIENVKYKMFRGVLNEDKGNYEKALEDYMKSLRISQIIKDSTAITDNLVNIGAFYFNLEKYQKSLEYYEQAQVYFNQPGKAQSLQASTSFRTMGIAYERIGQKELGILYANKSIGIAKKLNITKLLVFCYTGIATIYLEIKDYHHAEDYYLQCADLLKNTDLKFNKLSIYGQLGLVNFEQKKYKVAQSYFEEANKLALLVGRKSSIASSYKDLARTEAASGNFSMAYQYQKIYMVYRDSINAETSNKNIAEMEAKYQTEKKQHQIALLDAQNKAESLQLKNSKQVQYSLLAGLMFILIIAGLLWRGYRAKQKTNLELNLKNDEISSANEELTVLNEKLHEANLSKTKLFSILSHDLRSPVISLFQYMKFQEMQLPDLDDISKQKYHTTIMQSAANLTEVMEDILIWAKSQMEQFQFAAEYIDIALVISEIVSMYDIITQQKSIAVQVNCDNGLQFKTDVNFLRIILRNLISNAIKFSHTGENIAIAAKNNAGTLSITVKDHGAGFSKDQLAEIFNWNSIKSGTSGFGLKLTKEFVEKLGGILEIHSEPGKGAEFILQLRPV